MIAMTYQTLFRLVSAPLAAVLIALQITSCQKVISVDLNQTNPQLVTEGIVTDQAGPYAVTLSMSGNYFEPSLYFPPVSHAYVTISDDLGRTDTLREAASGSYHSTTLRGTPGRTYLLRVVTGGKEYDASSSMPQKVPIDTLLAFPRVERDGDRGYDLYVIFRDPPEPGNYYRMNLRVSVPLSPDSIDGRRYHLYNDKLTNGNEASVRIRMRNHFNPGDTVWVDLLSIDKSAYDYFNTLNDILTSDRAPTSLAPANPTTNLTNGSLGYFGAWAVDSKVIVLP
jgi:hypothetical protein